jgi:hypothetical protein
MATYKFDLTNYGGCYIGIEASTLKDACSIYQLIVRDIHRANNSVVDTVTRIKSEVLFGNGVDKN